MQQGFYKAFYSLHGGKMTQILFTYGLPKETVKAVMMLYKKMKVKFRSLDGDRNFFDIVAGVLQEDTLTPFLFMIFQDCVHRTSIEQIKENRLTIKKKKSQEADDIPLKLLRT